MVDLVRARVVEVLALEVDLGAAELLAETLGVEDGRRAANVGGIEVGELLLELFGLGNLVISLFWCEG